MENQNQNQELARKLEQYFENIVSSMEQKFANDYVVLRGYSNEFTDMYHFYYDNILPSVQHLHNESCKSVNEMNQSATQLRGLRSKTPGTSLKIVLPKEEKPTTIRIKITKASQMSPRHTERSKTPQIGRHKDKNDSKTNLKSKESDRTVNQSSSTLPTEHRVNEPKHKIIEERSEKIVHHMKDQKTGKRDLTPTIKAKKRSVLDVSQENIKDSKNFAKRTSKKDFFEDKKSPKNVNKKGSVTTTPLAIMGRKRTITVADKKINIDNLKLKTQNSNDIEEVEQKKEEPENKVDNREVVYNLIKTRIEQKERIMFSNKNTECLFLAANNKILPENLRLKIITNVKEIFSKKQLLKNILKDRIARMEEFIQHFNKNPLFTYINDPCLEALINKQFTPSKTAQNGLNFVTKDEEHNLCKKEQPEEILNVFRLIYILINEPYTQIPPQKLIENLTSGIFEKLGAENLKSLFLNNISKNTDLNDTQYDKINSIVKENPKILSSPDLLKVNRCVSYMTFILKEIFEYVSAKAPDDTPLFEIRKLSKKLNRLKEKVKSLNAQMAKY